MRLLPYRLQERRRVARDRRLTKRLFGPLAPMVPPPQDRFDGPDDIEIFKANGDEFLRIYKEFCGLLPDEKMLDVGSGIGRKTIPLTQYFARAATYDGIEITKKGVDWCREKITSQYPNFRFHHIDVFNKHYNPEGRSKPSEYRFPFDVDHFDFVMLGSVFTHMPTADAKNYLREVARVLRHGGRCLITYFLLNQESRFAISQDRSNLNFRYSFGNYASTSQETPEIATAFDELWVQDAYRDLGMTIVRTDYGSWSGRRHTVTYQDLILAVKG